MLNRKFEECSPDLADRIVNMSYKIKQKQSLYKSICGIFNEFYMPKPQYVLPLMLVIGFFISVTPATSDLYYFVDDLYLEGDFNE